MKVPVNRIKSDETVKRESPQSHKTRAPKSDSKRGSTISDGDPVADAMRSTPLETRDARFAELDAEIKADGESPVTDRPKRKLSRNRRSGGTPARQANGRTGHSSRKPKTPLIAPVAAAKLSTLHRRLIRSVTRDRLLSEQIKFNLSNFRQELVNLTIAAFPLKTGRRADPRVDDACEKVRQGKTVTQVLKEQIPNWDDLDPYSQMLARKGLNEAVNRRKRRNSKKSKNPRG